MQLWIAIVSLLVLFWWSVHTHQHHRAMCAGFLTEHMAMHPYTPASLAYDESTWYSSVSDFPPHEEQEIVIVV